jgi:crotonobetainyl-CoA:carnitine CoA-transferase CaiB-like acyl-CoA transferase
MILADFGAEIITIERPGGDPFTTLPSARMWRRGKHIVPLDLNSADGVTVFHKLCAGADVLVSTWRPNALTAKGLDFETLHERHPHLIFCHITGFGRTGPRANYPGYEHIVAACTGRMQVFTGLVNRDGPVFSALQVGIHSCAQSAATGILAALFERGDDGEGRLVETSLLQGLLAYEQGGMISSQLPERFAGFDISAVMRPVPDGGPPMPPIYYHPAQARDRRWMQFGNLLPHLFDNFLRVTNLLEVLTDPDFNAEQMLLPPQKLDAFRDRMLRRIQQRSSEEWMIEIIADGGSVATTYQTTQEALTDPDIVENGHAIKRPDGSIQLGPVARLARNPAVPGPDAVYDDTLASEWHSTPRSPPTRVKSEGPPLSGLRVLEIATVIAAPLGTSFLADMGAEVIKIEQIGGDPYRGSKGGAGSARVNAGKRSISLNLKSEAGREIVQDLIRDADVLIHNFRPGVPERLGIGYEQATRINSNIVYLQCTGYGPDGPGAHRPCTHPIPGAAMGGVLYQMGERVPEELQDIDGLHLWSRRLMRANEVNPDPNTAVVLTTAVLLGLSSRQRNGEGQRVSIDMFGANAYANFDDFLSYPGKPTRAMPDEGLHGLSATYRLYPCAGKQWIFLALTNEIERRRFVDTLLEAGIDAPTLEVLTAGEEPASDALIKLFASQDANFWEDLLASIGIGCVRADGSLPSEFWLHDAQPKALELCPQIEHPTWGNYRRHGPTVLFDGSCPNLGPPPFAGQHNEEVLSGYGYHANDIERLKAEGVLWSE